MSRSESDREDLLRDATALVERIELTAPGLSEPIVIGFRKDGSASFYFGADPVYQFNTASELRRAYVDGLLYKAERGRLVSLTRQRSDAAVTLLRAELDTRESAALLDALQSRLDRLRSAFARGAFVLVGQVPADANIVPRLQNWLAALPRPITIAPSPNER